MAGKLISITPSTDGIHKYDARFETDAGREKTVRFGAKGYEDYTQHHDTDRRRLYIERHKANENWSKPDSPGALSRFILWGESTSLARNIAAFRSRFNL